MDTEVPDSRREQLLHGTAGYLLEQGLLGFSLRPLAKALGTSDRMILYYFRSRDRLLTEALAEIGARLRQSLAARFPPDGVTPAQAVAAMVDAMSDPAVRAQLQLWVEAVALAARGDHACRQIVDTVTSDWNQWVQSQLRTPEAHREPAAASILAIADGLVILQLAGRDDLMKRAGGYLQSEGQFDATTPEQARPGPRRQPVISSKGKAKRHHEP